MSSIGHIILFSFLFLFFYNWGIRSYNIKDNKQFWAMALFPIAAYSIIVGCRYGWGNDYFWYKYQFEHTTSIDIVATTQLGWRQFNKFIGVLGLNYVGAYIIYSLIFIVCAFILIRSYGRESKYMYAFLLPATLLITTSTIRQSVAFSFVLLSFYFVRKKNWIYTAIFLIVSIFIHSSSLICVVWIAFFYFFVKSPLSWKVTIPVYLFFTFVWEPSQLGFINDYMKFLDFGDNTLQGYIDNSDVWFSAEATDAKYLQSALTKILSALFHISMIYFCYKSSKIFRTNRSIICLYNVIVITLIVTRAGFSFELIRRIGDTMFTLYFIPLGFCWYHYSKRKNLLNAKSLFIMNSCIYTILVFLTLYFGRWLLFFDDFGGSHNLKSMFIWNL